MPETFRPQLEPYQNQIAEHTGVGMADYLKNMLSQPSARSSRKITSNDANDANLESLEDDNPVATGRKIPQTQDHVTIELTHQ